MNDPKLFRSDNLENVAASLKRRGYNLDIDKIKKLEEQRKTLQVDTQNLQNERNSLAKEIGQKKRNGENADDLLAKSVLVNKKLAEIENQLASLQNELNAIYFTIPNIPSDKTPDGLSSDDNIEVRRIGTPRTFAFVPRDHVDLGEALKEMDFRMGAKLATSRFVVLYDDLAKLQRSIIQFMLDTHTKKHGYHEVYVPYLANKDSLFGTGNLPKFSEDLFNIKSPFDFLSLIPTAEVPVTNIVRDEIIDFDRLPLKFVCHTPCFRSEAGSYGRDMRGMIRNHQFEKVEIVQIVDPKKSYEVLEELTCDAEDILKLLELPYRVMALCAGDIGFSSAKTYDLEVWLPSQQMYREISSCSNYEAFQARRMKARFRNKETKKTEFVHTLNGSGLAVGRTLLAIMENYQDSDGSIAIPSVLQSYFGKNKIEISK